MLEKALDAARGQPEDQAVEIADVGYQRPASHGLRHHQVEGGAQNGRGGRVHHHQRHIQPLLTDRIGRRLQPGEPRRDGLGPVSQVDQPPR